MQLNPYFKRLKESYLFAEVAKRTNDYAERHTDKKIIKLGVGDVTLPLVPAVTEAMHEAVDEMSKSGTFKGYGPYEGYGFLRDSIKKYYKTFGVSVDIDEIFISDGAKSDLGNILDIFSRDNTALITDPVYPVYLDTNVMEGRRVVLADANEANGFLPMPDYSVKADIIYICSPNNPTGAAYTKAQLKEWVDYADKTGAVILYDAAYECFIEDDNLARSVFSIDGAKTCAIEICSLSKIAGFTGTRCGYCVIPEELERDGVKLNRMWRRCQSAKFNGVSYVVQRGAAAAFTENGMEQIGKNIQYYKRNAMLVAQCMDKLGIRYTGGINSPYIWMKCPHNSGSWEFFDFLLNNAQVVGTPGVGFGANGEGFFRLTAFGSYEETNEAIQRIQTLFCE